MITYRTLSRSPVAFRSLTGLSVPEFDVLCREWVYADAVARSGARLTRTKGTPRCRAPGGGRKYNLAATERLLMALVWLKVYPTWEVLAYLFGEDERSARRSTRDVIGVLEEVASFPLEFPLERRPRGKHGRSLEALVSIQPAVEVLAAEPAAEAEAESEAGDRPDVADSPDPPDPPPVEVLIDSREQRIRRPKGWQKQKPYFSGKKKAHTLKMQATVSLEGRIQAISESVPGTVSDQKLLEESGVIERLEPEEAAGADKGYVGAEKAYPGHPFWLPRKKPPGGELSAEEKSYNRALAQVRIAVEHVFAHMSHFGVLSQVFRHQRGRHGGVVRVVAWLVDRRAAVRLAAAAPA